MLKHYEIINRMSDSEKIHLLCDIHNLSEDRYREVGIPEIKLDSMDEFCGDEYPLSFALANTWDIALIGKTADALIEKAMERGVDFLRMPDPKIKISPYRRALSEDPFLASAISREYLKAADRAGMEAGLGEFGLYSDELEFLDEEPDTRLIRECVEKPYHRANEGKSCKAFFSLQDLNDTAYEAVNSDLAQNASEALGVISVCRRASTENTVPYIEQGKLFLAGAPLVAESALSRYKTLMKNIRQGIQNEDDLAQEKEKNRVLSSEKLDEAVDRLLDFIFSISDKKMISNIEPNEQLMRETAEKSVVLLKNSGKRLPLKKVQKIALIGDIAFDGKTEESSLIGRCKKEFTDLGLQVVGMERGYELKQSRSESMIEPAIDLAKESEAVVVFLGLGKNRVEKASRAKKISLPANQQALLDRLEPYKNKIIAVMPAEAPADIALPGNCAAILLAPFGTKCSADVLVKTLNGTLNPSGKLACTVYTDSDALYRQYRTHRKRDGLKQGTLIGYRYYDTAREKIAFPFGHGLSYAAFEYSGLSVKNGQIYVTIKNISKVAGDEIVQIYAGKEDSALIRPRKELCAFTRVSLNPGEKQRLTFPLALPEVYSEREGKYVTEDGEYTIYAGSSVSDIRLSCRISEMGVKLESDQNFMSDYIHTKSNIITDNYKLEAKIKTMKRSIFNLVAGTTAILMAVILRLYCFSMAVGSDFFTWFEVFLGVFGVALFIREAVQRNALRRQEEHLLKTKNEELFEDAERISKYAAEAMFAEEFDVAEDQTSHEKEELLGTVEMEYLDFVDKDQNFANAAKEFEIFARERGHKFHSDDSKKIFSALASSRLVILSGLNNRDFQTLLHLLSDYFETSLHMETVDESYHNGERVLFRSDLQGAPKTHTHLAMDEARMNPQNICLAGLTNVIGKNLPQYFSSYMSYVKNPLSNYPVKVLNDLNAETTYSVSPNLWFVLNLAEGESASSLPDFVAESAAVIMISHGECEESEQHTQIRKFSYYQMDYLTEKAVSGYSVHEDLWKRIDRLEEFAQRYAPFAIGNKLWLALEKFAYVYIACGGNETEALDEAVAAKLLLPVMLLLNEKMSSDDQNLIETVETVFGEDHAEACKKMIRTCESHWEQNI